MSSQIKSDYNLRSKRKLPMVDTPENSDTDNLRRKRKLPPVDTPKNSDTDKLRSKRKLPPVDTPDNSDTDTDSSDCDSSDPEDEPCEDPEEYQRRMNSLFEDMLTSKKKPAIKVPVGKTKQAEIPPCNPDHYEDDRNLETLDWASEIRPSVVKKIIDYFTEAHRTHAYVWEQAWEILNQNEMDREAALADMTSRRVCPSEWRRYGWQWRPGGEERANFNKEELVPVDGNIDDGAPEEGDNNEGPVVNNVDGDAVVIEERDNNEGPVVNNVDGDAVVVEERVICPRWTVEEQLVAVKATLIHGRDFEAIAELIGNKLPRHVKQFHLVYGAKYRLKDVLEDFDALQRKRAANDGQQPVPMEDEDFGSPDAVGMPDHHVAKPS